MMCEHRPVRFYTQPIGPVHSDFGPLLWLKVCADCGLVYAEPSLESKPGSSISFQDAEIVKRRLTTP